VKRFFLFLISAAAICLAASPHVVRAQENGGLVIVASTTQIADFARQMAGDRHKVRSIMAPGADPHTYMPTPEDVKLVQQADLTLQNGLNLEGKNWMTSLAADAGKPVFTCTEGIAPLTTAEEEGEVPDPHAWFSPENAVVYVNNILRAVLSFNPEDGDQIAARAKLYIMQLRALDGWMREQVNAILPDRRILVTSHDAFNYFCRAFRFNHPHGFMSLAPVGWSTGSEVGAGMTPESLNAVISSIRSFRAPAVFVETSVNPKLIREIAREAGVKIGGALYSDSMGAAGTAGDTYIGMMRENTLIIRRALAK
jgi:ABC-type Zn uptake system ZnuABC Zn-binding protein ZnuA